MRKFPIQLLMICVVITGCQTTSKQNVCDGFEKLQPNLETSIQITTKDRPFANQVAAHNRFGAKAGCWNG